MPKTTARHSNRYGENVSEPIAHGRWEVRRLLAPNPLWGSNGIAFGPDGLLYAAQYLAGQISAVDPATGETEVVVPMDSVVRSPDDLAFGADGSMYIADLVPGKVWRRSPSGVYSLVCDQVKLPNGITCVRDRLFVNEMKMDGRLLELLPDGGFRVLAEGLAMGNAMQLGPDDQLYYPHMMTGEVWRVPPDGGTSELVAEDVHEPVAVRFDQAGVMLVLSRGQAGIVTRIDLHRTGSRSLTTSGLAGLDNAAFDAENRMFVSSYANGGITQLDPDGRTRRVVRCGLDGPYGVTIDLAGTVHAADHYRIADPHSEAAGFDDRPAHVLRPFSHGIAADGRLLHLTSQYGEVRTYDPDPDRGATRVRARGLRQPMGVCVRSDGELVVAETGAGRVIGIDADGSVSVLADGFDHPVDVALDARGRCYVSDDQLGAVLRIDNGCPVIVADGLDAPQGLAVLDDDLFTVETGSRRLLAVSLETGDRSVAAENLAVGRPPGVVPRDQPALFAHGMPGMPLPFAGLSAAADGSLVLSANGEGTVLRLSPRRSRCDVHGAKRSIDP
ncbi:MAG: hypothetical protein ACRD0P_20565 [Stackebrandtia sp.]